jgi:hypothetical protein
VTFKWQEYEYSIYSKLGRSPAVGPAQDRLPEFEDGVTVSRDGKEIERLVCDDGGEGFRESVNSLPAAKSR